MQKFWPVIARSVSSDSTDLKAILADAVPKEQERVKNFRKAHGATKVGEVTVDMVSYTSLRSQKRVPASAIDNMQRTAVNRLEQ